MAVRVLLLRDGTHEDEAIAELLPDSVEDVPRELGATWVQRWLRFEVGGRAVETVAPAAQVFCAFTVEAAWNPTSC